MRPCFLKCRNGMTSIGVESSKSSAATGSTNCSSLASPLASVLENSSRSTLPSPSTSIFLKSFWICSSAIGCPPPGRVSTVRSSGSVMKPSPSRSNLAKAARSFSVSGGVTTGMSSGAEPRGPRGVGGRVRGREGGRERGQGYDTALTISLLPSPITLVPSLSVHHPSPIAHRPSLIVHRPSRTCST